MVMFWNFEHRLPAQKAQTNSPDTDQSSLFAILASIFLFPALKKAILFDEKD